MTTHHDAWPTGTPAWADITVPDLTTARAFYGPLLGWEFEVGGPELGFYTQAHVGGRRVVGMGEPMEADPPGPPAWCVYLAADDLAATTAAITEAGGKEIVPAMRIMDLGAMALFADTAGAVFGVWEPGTHTGWDVVDEPGAVVWCEVMVHDQPGALAFYQRVFGYTVEDLSAPGFQYASVSLEGEPLAGVGGYGPQAGADAPAAWTLYFGVADAEVSAAQVAELGGTVVSPATDTPFGRMAIVAGPFGEVFALMGPVAGGA
ncbi:VOC family protein [Cellulomonas fengjieae]|uniref:VOC family protein n=1 Tax=Cellulomonas fengjieae TaxID=2819978 RepID=A0ABS3SHC3_9CELL|nr:VOC family protein [Cellulomonas fengjieae]MBO3085147.1 VOC family protein [Cellulomonas fengjieae]MBO3100893.1 VOC family protein [Cellulomonas fengjieae]QVI66276.1 VOC family protein [Cellulomonas fengjieae]